MVLMVDAQGAGNSDDRLKRRRLHAGLFPWESLFGPIKLTRSQLVNLHAACLRLEQLGLPYGAAALRGAIVCCELPGGSVVVRRLLALDGDTVCVEGPRGVSCSLPLASVLEEEPTDAQWRQACVEAAGHLLRGSLRHWTCAEVRFTLQRLLELRLASEAIAAHAASQPSARQAQQQQRTSDPGLPPSRAAQDGAGPSQALPGRSFLRPRQLARPEGPGDDALRERLYEVLQVRARISDEQWREHASQLLPFTTADAIQALRRAAAAVASGAAGPSAAATAGGQSTLAAPAEQAATAGAGNAASGPNTTAAAAAAGAVPSRRGSGRVPVRAAVPGLRRAAAGRARQQPLQRAAAHVRVASAPAAAAAAARSLRAARGGAVVKRAALARTRPTTAPAGPSATTAGPTPGPGAQTVCTAPAGAPGGGSLQAPRVQLSAAAHAHALGHVPAAAAAPAAADAHTSASVLAVAAAPAAAAPAAPAGLALAAPAHGAAATTTTQPPRKRARPDVPTQPIAQHTAGAPTTQPGLNTPLKAAAGPQAAPVAPNPRRRREPADAGELESPAAPSHAKGTTGNEPPQPRRPLLTPPGHGPAPASLLPRQPLPARELPGGAEVPPKAGPQPDQEQAQRPPSLGPAAAIASAPAAGRAPAPAAALISGPALQPPAAVRSQTAAADAALAPGPSSVRAAAMGNDLSAVARVQARHGAQVQELPAAPVPSSETQTEEQHVPSGSQAAAQPLPNRPAAEAPALATAAAASDAPLAAAGAAQAPAAAAAHAPATAAAADAPAPVAAADAPMVAVTAAAGGPEPMQGIDDHAREPGARLTSVSAQAAYQPPRMPWSHEEFRWGHVQRHPDAVASDKQARVAAAAAAPPVIWPLAAQLPGWGEPVIAVHRPGPAPGPGPGPGLQAHGAGHLAPQAWSARRAGDAAAAASGAAADGAASARPLEQQVSVPATGAELGFGAGSKRSANAAGLGEQGRAAPPLAKALEPAAAGTGGAANDRILEPAGLAAEAPATALAPARTHEPGPQPAAGPAQAAGTPAAAAPALAAVPPPPPPAPCAGAAVGPAMAPAPWWPWSPGPDGFSPLHDTPQCSPYSPAYAPISPGHMPMSPHNGLGVADILGRGPDSPPHSGLGSAALRIHDARESHAPPTPLSQPLRPWAAPWQPLRASPPAVTPGSPPPGRWSGDLLRSEEREAEGQQGSEGTLDSDAGVDSGSDVDGEEAHGDWSPRQQAGRSGQGPGGANGGGRLGLSRRAAALAAQAEAVVRELPWAAVAWAERVLRFLRTQSSTQATYQQIRRSSLGVPRSIADPTQQPTSLLVYLRRFSPWFKLVPPGGAGSGPVDCCLLRAAGGSTWAREEARALQRLYDLVALTTAVCPEGMPLTVLKSSPACPPRHMLRGQELESWMRHFRHWTLEDGWVKVVPGERP
ncbi:hypothetical protein HYH03_018766 [Edaphochlamys debaryana]|uniref:Uncharacterized protein n=1 Tax=Edaphochlamys debaryana TaxID=47281 RepID=A0A835XFX6_9CHLO|nr:hypothetical protein HYH03_018766 [Edaphochlamys debaryana]|eukprot:KAG2482302.1 hypothetical protein HYH03_018766 [Edaphochlamys debaryana]